jgi:hypothetical protein
MATLFFDPHIFQTIDPGSYTVGDLITSTLKLIGAISGVETPSPDQLVDALARLNDMIDAWAANSMAIFQVVRTEHPLTAGKQVYTIGEGPGQTAASADFVAVRPIWIQRAGVITTAGPPPPPPTVPLTLTAPILPPGPPPAPTTNPADLELPVRILNADEWAAISVKGVTSTLSWYLWNDFAYPHSHLSVWPVPSANYRLVLYVPTPVSRFTSPVASIAFPPGWSEALRYNLALRLCPEWGRPIDPVIAGFAQQSFATLQRSNTRPQLLGMDAALIGPERHVYNWLTDRPGPF